MHAEINNLVRSKMVLLMYVKFKRALQVVFSSAALAQQCLDLCEHTALDDRLKMWFMLTINTLHNEMTPSAGPHPASGQPPARRQG